MGCITGKPSASKHEHEIEDIRRRSSLHIPEGVAAEQVDQKRKKSMDSQDLAY